MVQLKRNEVAEGFRDRGRAATEQLRRHRGDTAQLNVSTLKDFLRYKGVPAAEYNAGGRAELVAIVNAQFILGDFTTEAAAAAGNVATAGGSTPAPATSEGINTQAIPEPSDDNFVPLPPPPKKTTRSKKKKRKSKPSPDYEGESDEDDNDGVEGVFLEDASDTDEAEKLWLFENIVKGPNKNGKYKIKWVGCPDSQNSWEPPENIADADIRDYNEAKRLQEEKEDEVTITALLSSMN